MGFRAHRLLRGRGLIIAGMTALMAGLIAACGGGDDPTPTTSSPLSTPTATAPVLPAWEVQWNETLAAAEREGSFVVAVARQGYREGAELFMNFFPDINIEFQVGRGAEQRWIREYGAGIHTVDVSLLGSSGAQDQLMPAGIIQSIKGVMFRPDVVDDENWIGIRDDHFADDAKQFVFMHWASAGETRPFLNTELADAETFTVEDLLTPEFKGKWCLFDPRTRGSGQSWVAEVGATRGLDFVRRLLSETDPFISEDDRAMAGDLIRGEFIFCAGTPPVKTDFHDQGVGLHVVELFFPSKGLAPEFQGLPGVVSTCCGTGVGSRDIETFYGGGIGGPVILREQESPNAGSIFVNWLLTQEGARTYLEGTGQIDAHCSARSDLRGICKRDPPLQDNGSYFAMDHESTNFIENATAEIAEEALGGR